jgi:TolB protein
VAARLAFLGLLAGLVVALPACGGGGDDAGARNGRISFGKFDPALGEFRIWTAAADGSDERPLVTWVSWMSDWAPDGRRVVFEDTDTLATIGPDGTNPEVIVDSLGWQAIPKWSPTGEWVTFEGSEEKPADPVNASPDFERSVWIVRPNGEGLRRVTDRYDVEPVFSPDGSELAFGHVVRPGPPEDAVQSVAVVALDGTGRREIVPPTVGLQHVDWSPDGTWITYNIEPLAQVADQPPERGSIYAVRPDGTDLHVLVPSTPEWVFFKPVWSPDGKQLLTGCSDPGGSIERLCVVDLEGGDVSPLIDHGGDGLNVNFPAWGAEVG